MLKNLKINKNEYYNIIINSKKYIFTQVKILNKLMNNYNIGNEQRVLYISGMLLSMQDVINKNGIVVYPGLKINDLKCIQTSKQRDSIFIINHLQKYLKLKHVSLDNQQIIIEQLKNAISIDSEKDKLYNTDKIVKDLLSDESSITKQIFSYIYKYIYLKFKLTYGAIDIISEIYSIFIKSILRDGSSLGKVLTPSYITNMMAKLIDIDKNSKVMDLTMGSGAFLIAAMNLMITNANENSNKNLDNTNEIIKNIKKNQLLGIEVDVKMYSLAIINMLLQGYVNLNIYKGDTFKLPVNLFKKFNANKLLLNPPFSYKEYGLPFFEYGLDNMKIGGIGAVIIQDSAGSGKAISTAKRILSKHTMLASIKMPSDLFIPNAIVQTSIYIFKAGIPHNFNQNIVKFIDFRNDGYKRSKRCIKEIDFPVERYNDIYLIYKFGKNVINHKDFHNNLWNLENVYVEDNITSNGNDWNADRHINISTIPKEDQYIKNLKDIFIWNISKNLNLDINLNIVKPFKFEKIKVNKIFKIENATPSYNKNDLTPIKTNEKYYDYITRTSENQGICNLTGFISDYGKHNAGTFSLELMQKKFFYRKHDWYSGQFIKKIECIDNISEDSKLYLLTILNGLTPKLQSYIVRDIDQIFLNSDILLPINNMNQIDYKWMELYIKSCKKIIKNQINKLIDFN